MASSTKRHRYSSEKTVEQWDIATIRARSTTPSFELQESAGDKKGRMNLTAAGALQFQVDVGAGWVDAGIGAASPLTLTSNLAAEIPLTIVAHASQTANIQEWKKSTGTYKLAVDNDGQLVSGLDPNTGAYALTSSNKLGLEATTAIWLNTPVLSFPQNTTFSSGTGFAFTVGNNNFTITPNSGSFQVKNSNVQLTSERLRSSGDIAGNTSNDETAKFDVYNYTATTTISGTIAEIYTAKLGRQTVTHATTATTYTNAATLQIDYAPAAGANVTITNAWALRVKSGASTFQEVEINKEVTWVDRSSHPTLAVGESMEYRKGTLFVIAYNDGGTTKYRYLDLTSTDAAWTYTTTAP